MTKCLTTLLTQSSNLKFRGRRVAPRVRPASTITRELGQEMLRMPLVSIRKTTSLLVDLSVAFRPMALKRRIIMDVIRNVIEYTQADLMHPALLVTLVLGSHIFDNALFFRILDMFKIKMTCSQLMP